MGKRIDANKQRSKTQSYLNNQQKTIQGREATTFTGSAKDPFNAPIRDNYQTYPYDYFGGADCKVFFGDIWVDDIITIQYNVSQTKTPIYGYASQLFDAVARGQVIVEGTLSVSFKETGYLNIIQSIIESQRINAVELIEHKIETNRVLAEQGIAKFIPRLNYISEDSKPNEFGFSYSPNGTPQIIRQQQTIEQILASKKIGTAFSNKLLGPGNDKSRDFEDFAEILEDTIWGDSNGNPFALSNKLKRVDEFDYSLSGGIITAKGKNYANVLNIMLTFGDINDFRAEHTLVVLNDVHFISTGMIVAPTGDPIAETYSFIARDINDSISQEIKTNINPIKLNVGNDNIQLSKLKDIATIEEFLDKNPNQLLFIEIQAALDQYGWNSYSADLELEFVPNRITPFVDQLCLAVEKAMNEIRTPDVVNSSKTQYIVKVLDAGSGDKIQDITMILEQNVPNTRTYKVISPTRTGFSAPAFIGRDDLFTNISELPKPLDIVKSRIDENRAKLNASESAALAEKQRIQEETAALGLSDEQKALQEAKDKKAKQQEKFNKDGELSKFEQFRLDKRDKEVHKATSEYIDELYTPTSDRDLTRVERDRLVGLTNQYEAISDTLESLTKEEQNLINQENRYSAAIQKEAKVVAEQQAVLDAQKKEKANALEAIRKKSEEDAAIRAAKELEIQKDREKLLAELEKNLKESRRAPDKIRDISIQKTQDIYKTWGPKIEESKIALGSNVPTEFLVSIIAQESGGNVNAVSSTGAEGLAQFMPATYGEQMQQIIKEHPEVKITPVVGVYSPENSILALVQYTKTLYAKTGSLESTAAAYNAGLGALKQSKDDPRYTIYENPANEGYAETRNYVPSVMQRYYSITKPNYTEDNIYVNQSGPATTKYFEAPINISSDTENKNKKTYWESYNGNYTTKL